MRFQQDKQFNVLITLINMLKSINLFVMPVGELEGFVKKVKVHGPGWVNDVLSQYGDLHDPVYDEAKKFVKELQL